MPVALVLHELVAKRLTAPFAIKKEAELHDNGQPHVVWPRGLVRQRVDAIRAGWIAAQEEPRSLQKQHHDVTGVV
ncbi:uncharacterized protein ColSpa_01373 [Colletotrichum spaethianum]|uniref:Uncharacterized protein n=1 Tax=Colletotrichum spaethianum TaxID=700344 RepID=A0AA37L3G9_9PEZI|nr:uncharacterized protein ColSpa_01373 [Colletotrichum spaethianum]GKT41192.1 hypothetical protein ColSpa_01373 [Colletotrichum spaethianum]